MNPDASVFFPPPGDDNAQPAPAPAPARELMELFGGRFAAMKADLAQHTRRINQLKQAVGRLRAGDEARARRIIATVLQDPWDEQEESWPGWRAAMSLVHDTVVDDLESSAVDDDRWLRACEQIFAAADDPLTRAW